MQPMVEFSLRLLREAQEPYLRIRERIADLRQDHKIIQQVQDCTRQAELLIIRRIARGYPQHQIIGRFQSVKPQQNFDHRICWLIEPLYGEDNFCANSPDWAMSIQVQQQGRTVHAVILAPFAGDEILVSRGAGVQVNRRRMKLVNETNISPIRLACSMPALVQRKDFFATYEKMIQLLNPYISSLLASGNNFLDVIKVVMQQADAAIAFGLNAKDLALATLLLRETGALIAQPNGDAALVDNRPVMAGQARYFRHLIQWLAELKEC